jgi:hypothetical protein
VGVSVSFGNVGWYPLGPRDIFYPGYRHTPRYIRYVNVSNTVVINNNYFYGRRLPHPRFDYRHYPGAVTSVPRDHFVGGRRISDHWVRVDENHLRNWHAERRPPAIAPYRESVLGGAVRPRPRDADRFNFRRGGDYFAGRVPFHRERSAIESNGGRPIGRAELVDRGAKRHGDFIRPGLNPSDIKHRERALGLSGNDRRPRELNNDSVRDWQNRRDRDRNDNLSRPGNSLTTPAPRAIERNRDRDAREQLEIMRAEESSRVERRRSDHMQRQPGNTFQQGSNGFYRPPTDRSRDSRGTVGRSEPRQLSQPRSEPRRDYSPPRQEPRRDYSPPRQEPRSQPRIDRSPPRASPSNNNSGSNRGGDRGGSRPRSAPRER